ncbi:PAS domain-containing sensor histidine kinase [Methyloligella sp. 2.7D]|uniref:PAS domain-containing sensor histidine kinase n=1 Tax=unclassified Methyloligella TaxID=2625955 RepID=UPI00157C1CAF|nr:PAS domain-containing sensor histidine kinase [Methyloligella sp. GL2]QKP77095.1 PAS domain-containing sensor histidine kinase [Methyloligella sp. GL2]
MRIVSNESLRGFSAYFGSLVNASVRDDPLLAARHQSFITSHILGGVLALCVFPIYLVTVGKPSLLGAFVFLWFLSPIAIAVFLSRTGKFAAAHLISAGNFVGLIGFSAWLTGGITSFLIPWMVVVPVEAAMATNRKVVAWAGAFACAGLAVLGLGSVLGLVPAPYVLPVPASLLAFGGVVTAVLYAAGIAVSVQMLHSRSEEVARLGEERYRLLAENVTDMITRHDEKGRVLFASLASQQLLGVSGANLMGGGLFDRVHVADRPAFLTALSRACARNESIAVEFRLRRQLAGAAPDYIWTEMRCRPMRLADGRRDAKGSIIAVTRDISERKQQEAVLLQARDQAESASRAKTQFLANMSHELRTPLNAVIGFSEILNRELFGRLGEDRYRDYARLIHESGQHLLQVLNDILDMSKIEAGKFNIVREPFDVASLLKSCGELMRTQADQREINLAVELPEDMPELLADKRACKQMLLNVISNAIKFTEAGGTVQVRAEACPDAIDLIVSDDGIGIAEEDVVNLGNPFVQADNSYNRRHDGAGLGLSVVKGLVRLHGGRLGIESALGQGTTVTISLPKDKDASPEATERLPRQASAA